MKLKIILLFLFFGFTTSLLSQETAKPMTNTEIMRNVSRMDIKGKEYENVEVTFKSISSSYYSDNDKVKVAIVDKEGNELWKKL